MENKLLRGIVCMAAFVTSTTTGADYVVAEGWDIFHTVQPTNFMGFDFEGVDLGTFDFGQGGGPQNVGNTDTIVQRLEEANPFNPPPYVDTIDIELVALQLKSVSEINMGGGLGFHYITLSDEPSLGGMEITFDDENGGTFNSWIDVAFDIRLFSLQGPILFSDTLQLSADDIPWQRDHPQGALLIDGINHYLNGADNAQDFWPGFLLPNGLHGFTELHPSGAEHTVETAVPTPGVFILLGLSGLIGYRRRR